mgnify:CR=1 FL=1
MRRGGGSGVGRKSGGWSARFLLLLAALVLTVVVGGYQRRTGPSWPVPVDVTLGGAWVRGELPRSHPGEGGARISLEAPGTVAGEIEWRRYPTRDPWTHITMERQDGKLIAELPHQPPAAKLEYSVRLRRGEAEATFPRDGAAVIRYRGDVPAAVLLPHILCMFISLLFAIRAGLGGVVNEARPARFIPWILAFLVPGGLLLGPIVQKLSFGAYWTGWPFGEDWTDNKTLAVVLVWGLAWLWARRRPARERTAVLLAVVIMLAVYFIPHSTLGS